MRPSKTINMKRKLVGVIIEKTLYKACAFVFYQFQDETITVADTKMYRLVIHSKANNRKSQKLFIMELLL